MYNIHSHYENILAFACTIIAQPRVVYLHPFGSTQSENIESLNTGGYGPLLFCYDQEPLLPHYNKKLFDKVAQFKDDSGQPRPTILLNTEKHSEFKNQILEQYKFSDCSYFFHAFAAADWYRGYQYCTELIPPSQRTIQKKYITFNRLTGGSRAYRSFLVAELARNDILDQGYVSYSDVCPEHGHYESHILATHGERGVSADYIIRARYALDRIRYPLRIDNTGAILNGSQTLGPINELMTSFLHVVTETCYWDNKTHLTEKIFKPIVARQPFVLLGCVNNLKYLRSYGFKTFDAWWDESYDSIADPIERLQAVVKIINDICAMSNEDLTAMLRAMQHVLDYNYNRFYSKEFIDYCWNELTENLEQSLVQLQPPTVLGI
jgi:hypothetical protein